MWSYPQWLAISSLFTSFWKHLQIENSSTNTSFYLKHIYFPVLFLLVPGRKHQLNVGLEVTCREVTSGAMEVEKLSDKVLIEKRYETEMWVTFTSSMLCGKWACEGYSKKENSHCSKRTRRGHGHRGQGRKSSEKKGQSIKKHRPQRGQGSSRRHSTRVLKGQFQPQAQLVIWRKQFLQRSGGRLLTPGVDEKVLKELEITSTDCS